ncbi:MAG: hypothetical protein HY735_04315 [Verrucomicrobia bacterium]|nr:hypothetical protein [Verrucomicrobiota bacterium]
MRMERVRWEDWDAARCVAGDCEMVVGFSAGPRILSLRHGTSGNLLYRDRQDFRVGNWRLYGGHRFTVAPEGEDTYAADNEPCDVEMRERQLRVAAPLGTNGTRRVLVIGAAADGGAGFDIQHVMENHSERVWRGALWGITCVPRAIRVVALRRNANLRFWPGGNNAAFRGNYQLTPEHLVITPDGARGKAGWHSEAGWLASLQAEATLVIHCPEAPPLQDCVDDGCNLEVFTCAEYVELETLSGLVALAPRAHATHLQRWRLLPPVLAPHDGLALEAVIRGLAIASLPLK